MQQTHRFILIEDLTRAGHQTVMECTAADAATIYSTHDQARLALGHTVRFGDVVHTDMQAAINIRRAAPPASPRRTWLDAVRATFPFRKLAGSA